jgi:D-alanyl-D-alanine dipeptidase
VDVQQLEPSLVLDVRYATTNNFLRRAVYPVARVLLRRPVAERLVAAHRRLQASGLRLKVYDGYRPLSVQRQMWSLLPDPRYVADPAQGSRHNRGAAVDVTLVDGQGRELELPTAYDDFTPRAAADAPTTATAARNRAVLQQAMEAEGFRRLASEWWHFDGPGADGYGLVDVPLTATAPVR